MNKTIFITLLIFLTFVILINSNFVLANNNINNQENFQEKRMK
jgi:hypothetical protein